MLGRCLGFIWKKKKPQNISRREDQMEDLGENAEGRSFHLEF